MAPIVALIPLAMLLPGSPIPGRDAPPAAPPVELMPAFDPLAPDAPLADDEELLPFA